MPYKSEKFLCLLSTCVLAMVFAAPAKAMLLAPVTPYLEASDSPFFGQAFDYFYLEDFEDQALNTPGVTASTGLITSTTQFSHIIDSVDADDGTIDGSGLAGDTLFSSSGSAGISFTFDAGVLGSLPTSAGIVWTDGAGFTTFEAFDAGGVSLGDISILVADANVTGETAEDTFFGAINSGGISRIFISNVSGGIEVDHLQYGLNSMSAIPVPAAVWLFGTALLGLVGFSKRRKAA